MGFRFRKSIKVLPGVKVNLSKNGVGMTVGPKNGPKISKSATGRTSVSAPTGISGLTYRAELGSTGKKARSGGSHSSHNAGNQTQQGKKPGCLSIGLICLLVLVVLGGISSCNDGSTSKDKSAAETQTQASLDLSATTHNVATTQGPSASQPDDARKAQPNADVQPQEEPAPAVALADGNYRGISISDFGQIDAWLTVSNGQVYSLAFSGEYAQDEQYSSIADMMASAIVSNTDIPQGGFEAELLYAYEGAYDQALGVKTAEEQSAEAATRQEAVVHQREAAEAARAEEEAAIAAAAAEASVSRQPSERTYVLNNNTMKFHFPSCPSVKKISDHNRGEYAGTRDDLITWGYSPCGNCRP